MTVSGHGKDSLSFQTPSGKMVVCACGQYLCECKVGCGGLFVGEVGYCVHTAGRIWLKPDVRVVETALDMLPARYASQIYVFSLISAEFSLV